MHSSTASTAKALLLGVCVCVDGDDMVGGAVINRWGKRERKKGHAMAVIGSE